MKLSKIIATAAALATLALAPAAAQAASHHAPLLTCKTHAAHIVTAHRD